MTEMLHELARCMNGTTHVGFGSAQPTGSGKAAFDSAQAAEDTNQTADDSNQTADDSNQATD